MVPFAPGASPAAEETPPPCPGRVHDGMRMPLPLKLACQAEFELGEEKAAELEARV